jgi:hypothetical protein
MLSLIQDADYHLILAHLLQDNETYRNFYMQCKGFKILDNGAAEGRLVDPELLLVLATGVDADEVVCPDVLGDFGRTIDHVTRFKGFELFDVMVVLQCRTWTEFDDILDMALYQGAKSVALPKIMTKYLGTSSRLMAAERVRKVSNVPIHALGCTSSMGEAKALARQGIIRGIDTAAPIVQALHRLPIEAAGAPRPSNYFDVGMYYRTRQRVEANIAQFRSWCEETSSGSMRGLYPQQ